MPNFRKGSDCVACIFCGKSCCYTGIEKKQDSSGSINVREEDKLQFWNEIRGQVEYGQNKEDRWKRTILRRVFQFSPVDPKTVLHKAVVEGIPEIVKFFVNSGADVKRKNTDGRTVLHYAATTGTIEMVKDLVEKSANVNGKNTDGWAVLHSAVTEVS